MKKIKCDKCGRTLEISDNQKSVICRYCGSRQILVNQQTSSSLDDESNKNEIYNSAISDENIDTIQSLENAIKKYSTIIGWKDSYMRIYECQKRIEEIRAREEQAFLNKKEQESSQEIFSENTVNNKSKNKDKKRKRIAITTSVTAVFIVFLIVLNVAIIPSIKTEGKYNEAVNLMNSKNYGEAVKLFSELKGYKDSEKLWRNLNADTISISNSLVIGLKSDGTVVLSNCYDDKQYNVENWKDMVSVSAGHNHAVGLRSDGTVAAVGDNDDGQCDVEDWKDIVAISAGYDYTLGLKSDGTVVVTGYDAFGIYGVKRWSDIIYISARTFCAIGLKSDGTVVAVGDNYYGQCDVEDWKDIVTISAGDSHTVGLKSDGTVVATGDNEYGQCDMEEWKDIVEVSAGWDYTVGLKKDGTVVVSNGFYREHELNNWNNIVEIEAYFEPIGLKDDGTLMETKNSIFSTEDDDWSNIKLPYSAQ